MVYGHRQSQKKTPTLKNRGLRTGGRVLLPGGGGRNGNLSCPQALESEEKKNDTRGPFCFCLLLLIWLVACLCSVRMAGVSTVARGHPLPVDVPVDSSQNARRRGRMVRNKHP